ncbi:hypothetical protein H5410_028244 [Solanum commersonii]|uniref:Uncharacterized protein n=1 Tax=Solanum commersonii TaxID=4109 RepID=A0A9J5Z490_SOLCO|nr:hypothetical protein H5410_028244 [Solanum commersonii]
MTLERHPDILCHTFQLVEFGTGAYFANPIEVDVKLEGVSRFWEASWSCQPIFHFYIQSIHHSLTPLNLSHAMIRIPDLGKMIRHSCKLQQRWLQKQEFHKRENCDFIHHDKLFDLLSHVGELTKKVSTLVCELEERSRTEESINCTNRATLDLLKDIKLLKRDLSYVYLIAPDSSQVHFSISDGPLFMHLLVKYLNDLLHSNAYSIVLIKEEIGWVKEDLEFIRSFFMNIE